MTDITPGTHVLFREDTPQYAANKGFVYTVVASPSGEPFSVSAEGRHYVWLEAQADNIKPPSRRRRRTGWISALKVARPCDVEFGGEHEHDDTECAWLLDAMNGYEDYDDGYADALNREAEESMLGRPLFPNEY